MNNIFILGPVASGKNTLLDNIAKENDVIALDTGKIFRYIAYKLCEKFDLEINFEGIYQNDEQEIKKMINKIYHSTKYINNELQDLEFKKTCFFNKDGPIDEDCLYKREVNALLPIIAKISTIRHFVLKYIDQCVSLSDKPIVMTGHNFREIDTSKFTVVYLDVTEKESAFRLYERNTDSYDDVLDAFMEVVQRNEADKINETKRNLHFLYNYIYIDTNDKSKENIYNEFLEKLCIYDEKNKHFRENQLNAINRIDFEWSFNPVLEPLRTKLIDFTKNVCLKYPFVNQSDLIYQTLILVSSCTIFDLYSYCDFRNNIFQGVYRNKKTPSSDRFGCSRRSCRR